MPQKAKYTQNGIVISEWLPENADSGDFGSGIPASPTVEDVLSCCPGMTEVDAENLLLALQKRGLIEFSDYLSPTAPKLTSQAITEVRKYDVNRLVQYMRDKTNGH